MKYGQKLKLGDAHVTPRNIQEVEASKLGDAVTTHFCKPGKLVVTLSCEKFGANKNFISFVA
jgi:hypothetical protein